MPIQDQEALEITHLLRVVRQGDAVTDHRVMSAIHGQLRRLAAARMSTERSGDTLQPTALVHEAWLRLGMQEFENRAHFFGAAAEAMRRILVDRARRRQCAKHGNGSEPLELEAFEIAAPAPTEELLAVHEALDRLAAHDPRKAELVKLRYFVGLPFSEAAALLGISIPTAKRDWAYARAWLHESIRNSR